MSIDVDRDYDVCGFPITGFDCRTNHVIVYRYEYVYKLLDTIIDLFSQNYDFQHNPLISYIRSSYDVLCHIDRLSATPELVSVGFEPTQTLV